MVVSFADQPHPRHNQPAPGSDASGDYHTAPTESDDGSESADRSGSESEPESEYTSLQPGSRTSNSGGLAPRSRARFETTATLDDSTDESTADPDPDAKERRRQFLRRAAEMESEERSSLHSDVKTPSESGAGSTRSLFNPISWIKGRKRPTETQLTREEANTYRNRTTDQYTDDPLGGGWTTENRLNRPYRPPAPSTTPLAKRKRLDSAALTADQSTGPTTNGSTAGSAYVDGVTISNAPEFQPSQFSQTQTADGTCTTVITFGNGRPEVQRGRYKGKDGEDRSFEITRRYIEDSVGTGGHHEYIMDLRRNKGSAAVETETQPRSTNRSRTNGSTRHPFSSFARSMIESGTGVMETIDDLSRKFGDNRDNVTGMYLNAVEATLNRYAYDPHSESYLSDVMADALTLTSAFYSHHPGAERSVGTGEGEWSQSEHDEWSQRMSTASRRVTSLMDGIGHKVINPHHDAFSAMNKTATTFDMSQLSGVYSHLTRDSAFQGECELSAATRSYISTMSGIKKAAVDFDIEPPPQSAYSTLIESCLVDGRNGSLAASERYVENHLKSACRPRTVTRPVPAPQRTVQSAA